VHPTMAQRLCSPSFGSTIVHSTTRYAAPLA
jgi:hypothetical protein